MFSILRILFSVFLFLTALLTVVPAPTNSLWKLSIVVLESGYFLVFPCLLLAYQGISAGMSGKIAALLFTLSALLFATPLLRAVQTAHRLEKNFTTGFGRNLPQDAVFHRPQILSWKDLLLGIKPPRIEPRTLIYATHDSEQYALDFYHPTDQKPASCIVLIHGGGWDSGDRRELRASDFYFASLGYAVASIDYRLAPRDTYPAPVLDVKDALAFLRLHAETLGIDSSRFVLLGRSAGGQIALQAAYTLKDPAIRGVIAFYAPADMVFGYSLPGNPLILNSRKLMEHYLSGSYAQKPENYRASSPLESVESSSPPTLLLQGGQDVLVSYQHTLHLEEKMNRIGAPHFTVDLPWATHAYDFVLSGPSSQISLYFIERFLAQVTQ